MRGRDRGGGIRGEGRGRVIRKTVGIEGDRGGGQVQMDRGRAERLGRDRG